MGPMTTPREIELKLEVPVRKGARLRGPSCEVIAENQVKISGLFDGKVQTAKARVQRGRAAREEPASAKTDVISRFSSEGRSLARYPRWPPRRKTHHRPPQTHPTPAPFAPPARRTIRCARP